MDRDRLKIFSGTANPPLAAEICECLDVALGDALIARFSDGEVRVQLNENVRGVAFYAPVA